MLPQGIIWQRLRQRALTTIPARCHIPFASPPTLSTWLNRGALSAAFSTPRSFTLLSSPEELGAALFSEASFLLDHACEHSVTVRAQLAAGRWYSGAWLVVTFYYWSFFLISALSRMLGLTSWFLTADEARNLHLLAGGAGRAPGAGPYVLQCQPASTVGPVQVVLKRASKARVHDLAWRLFFDEIRALLPPAKTREADEEERLFFALLESCNRLGSSWPSDLRNLVNYGPGVGYAAVRRASRLGVFGIIGIDPPSTFATTLDRLEYNVTALPNQSDLASDVATPTKTLVDMTFALDSLTRALYAEVVERHGLDRRWFNARADFLRNQFRVYGAPSWPYRAAA